ncbi:biotin carboxylase [bacterium BMS3Bbin06]|nr:biotin carboxylase [bacterium BMS3Abin08]GBE35459.1 biotin carboxylase [bacterium BMS3Bbin06]HDO35189.1 acetyl-CoA carboxylase biotin carboxylase subunit [Nitrospirota bacterium]
MKLFKKILIANRGEIAVRIIRACRELGIKTVVVYSEIDRETMPVRLADEAVCIGPADPAQSYLHTPAILSAAEITDSEAIHPGYGFLSENPQFAEACMKSGITFIGPKPENIRLGGEKARTRQLLKKKGVPVVPGSDGIVKETAAARKIAKKVGFPVILKATAGGGGRGMRIVEREEALEDAFNTAQREALTVFGKEDLYIEKYISEMRHIEVQILADNKGTVIHLGERDCSIQRRHQKLIEEAPAPGLSDRLRKKIGDYALKTAKALRYRNAGTVEFIIDPDEDVYFMEINTRVQVEHPITEAVTGVDIIKEQIRLAAGFPLEIKQSAVKFIGHAIECRINAEDPEKFIPSSGKITFFYPPGGPGVRVDTAAFMGWTVSTNYDSLIAKLIVVGKDRDEAIIRMLRALGEFVVEGIQTTIPFHIRVLSSERFLKGKYNTSFVEKLTRPDKEK